MKFGDCELMPDRQLVTPEGNVQLSPRQARVLASLLASRSVAVATDELLDAGWGLGAGSPQQLAKTVFGIRQALAGSKSTAIESIYGYGYRLRVDTAAAEPDPRTIANAICEEAFHRLSKRRGIPIKAAQNMFEEALRVDPGYVRALLGYAETRFQLILQGYEPGVRGWSALEGAARDALAQEPESSAAMAFLGLVECAGNWNFAASDAHIDEALRRNPWDPDSLDMAGRTKLFQGQADKACTYFRRALQVSPMKSVLRAHLIWALTALGDLDDASRERCKLHQLDPEGALGHCIWYEALFGDPLRGIEVARGMPEDSPMSAARSGAHALALARAGDTTAARSLLKSLQDRDRYPTPYSAVAAMAWCDLGDMDAAVSVLEAAAAERDFWLGPVLSHPFTRPLRDRPEVVALRRRLSGIKATVVKAS